MTETLLSQVKRKLNITWEDADTNKRLADIIQSAIPALKHKLGIADPNFDFVEPGMENDLFKAYCFYEWNHCLNEFDDNYANNILQVRAMHEVEFYKTEESADED
jgi:hypothetical protein